MTPRPLPLRRRVMLASMLLGFVLSLSFALAAIAITEDYEHVLASEILQGQAEDYSLRLANGLAAQLPQTHRLSGYRGHAPAPYDRLGPGVHEDAAREGVHIGVFDTSAGRLYFVVDLGGIEVLERHLDQASAAIVVLGTLLSGWLGWLLARRALAPVSTLAQAVDRLPVTPSPSHLADTASPDDLGRLAEAIDRYQARLVTADRFEQAFFADASHELRTPVAVVQSAAELLRDDAGDAPAMIPRLQRLDRGIGELAELLDILMRLARRQRGEPESVEAEAWVREVLPATLARFAPGIALDIDCGPRPRWTLPRHEAGLLLRAVARRVVPSGAAGRLSIRLRDDGIDLARGAEWTEPPGPRRQAAGASDRDFGTGLLGRLAAEHGWSVSGGGHGATLRWPVGSGSPPP